MNIFYNMKIKKNKKSHTEEIKPFIVLSWNFLHNYTAMHTLQHEHCNIKSHWRKGEIHKSIHMELYRFRDNLIFLLFYEKYKRQFTQYSRDNMICQIHCKQIIGNLQKSLLNFGSFHVFSCWRKLVDKCCREE